MVLITEPVVLVAVVLIQVPQLVPIARPVAVPVVR
jgi:hypothetical protein